MTARQDAAGVGRAAAVSVGTLGVHGFPAFVGLGSNLRDPASQVRAGRAKLSLLPNTLLVCCSSLFGSRPMGPVKQPDFCNAVAGVLTELDARSLHGALRTIEQQMGANRRASAGGHG